MIELSQALTVITAAIGLVKELNSTEREISKAELKLKAAELMSALADAKVALIEARDEISRRDEEIARLTESFEKIGDMLEFHGYYHDAKNNQPIGVPYCPHCKNSGKWERLTSSGKHREAKCPNCKNVFGDVAIFPYERPVT